MGELAVFGVLSTSCFNSNYSLEITLQSFHAAGFRQLKEAHQTWKVEHDANTKYCMFIGDI